MEFILTALTFSAGGEIPQRHTCFGADTSPALSWSGAPPGTKTFAIVVDDPDAPGADTTQEAWVHWLIYNIPSGMNQLPEDVMRKGFVAGALEGLNDWNQIGWRGPCPPTGRHRYRFRLYALDVVLLDQRAITRVNLEAGMKGHVLADAELIAVYTKK
jgi:Raf kinase inhibitor-like YbhB/YbcL family protein